MSQRVTDSIEFIRINGEPVRVTSWVEVEPGTFRLVAIVRGSGDARSLGDLLAQEVVTVEIPGSGTRPMTIMNVDRRQAGEAPAIITRFSADIALAGEVQEVSGQSLEDRISSLEREVALLRQIVESLAREA